MRVATIGTIFVALIFGLLMIGPQGVRAETASTGRLPGFPAAVTPLSRSNATMTTSKEESSRAWRRAYTPTAEIGGSVRRSQRLRPTPSVASVPSGE